MSMRLISSLSYSDPSLKPPLSKPTSFSRFRFRPHTQTIPISSSPTKIQPLCYSPTKNLLGFSHKRSGFLFVRNLSFVCASREDGADEAENEDRGESTMPERFRYLAKAAPSPTVRWPWFVALALIIYSWRTVLFELLNWKNGILGIIRFVGYLLKLVLALIFHFIGDPITTLIRTIETAIYTVRSFYSSIVAYAPIPELTTIIFLSSAVLAIAKATVPNAINSQPYLLTLSSLIGYAAVRGYISEPIFWTLLFCLYSFSRFVKKRDNVSSALPSAAVLAAIGEPWVRVLVMSSYLGLAIVHHSKKVSQGYKEVEVVVRERGVPLPLLGAALAIGIRVAAKWAGYRHLTWKIV